MDFSYFKNVKNPYLKNDKSYYSFENSFKNDDIIYDDLILKFFVIKCLLEKLIIPLLKCPLKDLEGGAC